MKKSSRLFYAPFSGKESSVENIDKDGGGQSLRATTRSGGGARRPRARLYYMPLALSFSDGEPCQWRRAADACSRRRPPDAARQQGAGSTCCCCGSSSSSTSTTSLRVALQQRAAAPRQAHTQRQRLLEPRVDPCELNHWHAVRLSLRRPQRAGRGGVHRRGHASQFGQRSRRGAARAGHPRHGGRRARSARADASGPAP